MEKPSKEEVLHVRFDMAHKDLLQTTCGPALLDAT